MSSAPPSASVQSPESSPALSAGSRRITLQFVGMGLVWGASFLFMKVALTGVSFGQVAWTRILLGALTLGIIALATRAKLPRNPKIWMHFSVIAITYCVIPYSLFAWSEQYISSSLASILNAVTPIMTALMATLLFRVEKLSAGQVFGIAVGILGVIIIVAPWQAGALVGDWQGQLACIGAVTSYGFSFGYLRKFLTPYQVPSITAAFMYMGIAGVIMLVLTPVVAWQPVDLDIWVVLSLVGLGAFGTGIVYIWNMNVLAAWGPTATSSVTYITPVVGVILGVLLLSESLGWHEPLGAVIVFLGILLTQKRLRLPKRSVPQV
ncbi:drug/metabolite transporter (DMT)-like permease [Okibacterium sp. HSC-33S16]|uniref:DMT family transporter n=1 Tax=Okibacterium sp. HSC-33S16 TaxID=2910965 RepID=UPI0027E29BCB|nr:DMT family transporter [Okibacterium sp. HSC-33S16]MCP2031453.1 drug/metabolite transporter (DMT)-like permease [Okibacterium sp. HSC-33S16]